MNNLPIQLVDFLKDLRARVTALLHTAEDSMVFERAVTWYESLEPRAQRWLRNLGKVVALIALLSPVLWTLSQVSSMHAEQNSTLTLLDDMRRFNAEAEVVHQPPPRPAGWQAMNAASAEEVQGALTQYFNMIGISSDSTEITPSGTGLNVKINELTIKQATSIVFQIDGAFPKLLSPRLTLRRHPESKDLLTMEVDVDFKAPLAGGPGSLEGMDSPPSNVAHGRGGQIGSKAPGRNDGKGGDAPSPQGDFNGNSGTGLDDFNNPNNNNSNGDLPPPPFEDEM